MAAETLEHIDTYDENAQLNRDGDQQAEQESLDALLTIAA
jgi:hypothetical protein